MQTKSEIAKAMRREGKRLREIAAELHVSVTTASRISRARPAKSKPAKCTASACQFPAHGVKRLARAKYACACCSRDHSLESVFMWDASDGKVPRIVNR